LAGLASLASGLINYFHFFDLFSICAESLRFLALPREYAGFLGLEHLSS
jgi:hypothetical protein